MIKKVFYFLFFLAIVYFLMTFSYQIISTIYTYTDKDVSNKPIGKNIIHKEFSLVTDVFLYKYSKNDSAYYIKSPGNGSGIPRSIEDYLRFGENCNHSESYLQYTNNKPEMYSKKYICGILPKGTKILVLKITHSESYSVNSKIMNGEFKDIEASSYSLFLRKGPADDTLFFPNPKYLAEL